MPLGNLECRIVCEAAEKGIVIGRACAGAGNFRSAGCSEAAADRSEFLGGKPGQFGEDFCGAHAVRLSGFSKATSLNEGQIL